MEKENLRKQITVGVVFIVIGLCFLLKDFVGEKREKVFNGMNLELNELFASNSEVVQPNSNEPVGNEPGQTDNGETVQPVEEGAEAPVEAGSTEQPAAQVTEVKPTSQTSQQYESYAGILEIPKIGFNKGFYKKESSLNNVKFNLKILPQSNYPDEDKGNVIIIGHSGNYSNSYFANLYKLEVNDTASIKYNGRVYNYKIVNIYTDKKDGTLTIYRNETKNCLTLITCTKDDEETQTIYILELVNIS